MKGGGLPRAAHEQSGEEGKARSCSPRSRATCTTSEEPGRHHLVQQRLRRREHRHQAAISASDGAEDNDAESSDVGCWSSRRGDARQPGRAELAGMPGAGRAARRGRLTRAYVEQDLAALFDGQSGTQGRVRGLRLMDAMMAVKRGEPAPGCRSCALARSGRRPPERMIDRAENRPVRISIPTAGSRSALLGTE